MDMRKLVGRNVRRIRLRKGLTQERLAELCGFSQQYRRKPLTSRLRPRRPPPDRPGALHRPIVRVKAVV